LGVPKSSLPEPKPAVTPRPSSPAPQQNGFADSKASNNGRQPPQFASSSSTSQAEPPSMASGSSHQRVVSFDTRVKPSERPWFRPFDENTRSLVFGLQPRAIQGMLDFDFSCGRKVPSVAAMIYSFGGHHVQKFCASLPLPSTATC
jgi:ATP citrate (pro-S)-lyase